MNILNNIRNKYYAFKILKDFKMSFYAVAKGRTPGIFFTWSDCETQVKGFSGARYKKFNTVNEAQAFLEANGDNKLSKAIRKSDTKTVPKLTNITNNRKRPFATTSSSNLSTAQVHNKSSSKKGKNTDSLDSDEEISDILNKHMDKIEKGIKNVERNVNKMLTKYTTSKTVDIEPKKIKTDNNFEVDNDGFVVVYTDGACSGNGHSGAKAGLGVFWGEGHSLNISEPVSGRATNNCGEIQAAIRAIHIALQNNITHLKINTDSKFLINSITKWIPGMYYFECYTIKIP